MDRMISFQRALAVVGAVCLFHEAENALAATQAPHRGNFEAFDTLSVSAAKSVRAKLSAGGFHLRLEQSLLLTVDGSTDLRRFRDLEDPSYGYTSDYELKPVALRVSPAEMVAMIDSIAPLSEVMLEPSESFPMFSFMLIREGKGGVRDVFEALLTQAKTQRLVTSIRAAVQSNIALSDALREYALGKHLPTLAVPRERTSDVAIEFEEMPRDSGAWARPFRVQITNHSDSSIVAPAYLLVEGLPANAKVLEGDWTHQIRKWGTQYATLPLRHPLLREKSAVFEVRFAMDPRHAFVPKGRLCSGPGDP